MRISEKNRKIKPIIVIFLVFFFISFVILGILLSVNIFSVKKVNIKNDAYCYTKPEIINKLKILGANIFSLKYTEQIEKIKSEYPCILDIHISRKLPDSVDVDIKNKSPLYRIVSTLFDESSFSFVMDATLSAKTSEDVYFSDETGVIYAKNLPATDIAEIYIPNQEISIGKKLPEGLSKNIKDILNTLNNIKLKVSRVFFTTDSIIVQSDPNIIFNPQKDIKLQLASLQLILEKAKIDEEIIKFMDLRFDKPIVRFESRKK